MILLTSTSDKIQVITTAAGKIDVHASYIDLASGVVSAGRKNSSITTATTTDIVDAPAGSTARNVKQIKVSNNHASVTNVVSIQHTDGTTVIILESVTLLPGERMGYEEGSGIRVFDTAGREKVIGVGSPFGNANLADQTGFAADTYIAGSNVQVGSRVQAGSYVKWKLRAAKTAAGVAAAAIAVRVGPAGTTADTARATHTLAAATAAIDTGLFEIDLVFRAIGASAVLQSGLVLNHTSAGFTTAGLIINNVLSASFALGANDIIGLSLNGGTSAAWTLSEVITELGNVLS